MRTSRWVCSRSTTLGRALDELGAGPAALDEGRVFVDGVRAVTLTQTVLQGAVVTVGSGREGTDLPVVLGWRGDIVAVQKPAWMSTEPDRTGRSGSLLDATARLVGRPASVLHALGRLDVGTSGVVLLAVSPRARRMFARARRRGAVRRRYLAVLSAQPSRMEGSWTGPLDGRRAETSYRVMASLASVPVGSGRSERDAQPTLVAVDLGTGRRHQIRRHASAAGVPVFGDRRHGGPTRWTARTGGVLEASRLALHAAWVELEGDASFERVEAPVPRDFARLWAELGGEPAALDLAVLT